MVRWLIPLLVVTPALAQQPTLPMQQNMTAKQLLSQLESQLRDVQNKLNQAKADIAASGEGGLYVCVKADGSLYKSKQCP